MNINILLRHSGVWQFDIHYKRYKSDEIVIAESILYLRLMFDISLKVIHREG